MTVSRDDVLLSWILVLVVGIGLWPPRAVYWESVATHIGDGPTLLIVGVVALLVGVAIHWATSITLYSFVIGSIAAYVSGMAAIAVVLEPDSPVHLVLYAAILLCLIGGSVAHRLVESGHRRSDSRSPN